MRSPPIPIMDPTNGEQNLLGSSHAPSAFARRTIWPSPRLKAAALLRLALINQVNNRQPAAEALYRRILELDQAPGMWAIMLVDRRNQAPVVAVMLPHLTMRPTDGANVNYLGQLLRRQQSRPLPDALEVSDGNLVLILTRLCNDEVGQLALTLDYARQPEEARALRNDIARRTGVQRGGRKRRSGGRRAIDNVAGGNLLTIPSDLPVKRDDPMVLQ